MNFRVFLTLSFDFSTPSESKFTAEQLNLMKQTSQWTTNHTEMEQRGDSTCVEELYTLFPFLFFIYIYVCIYNHSADTTVR